MPAKGEVKKAEQQLRAHALSYPEAVEEFPWGHYAFKVKGKTFCFMGKDEPEINLACKLPQSRDAALGFDWAEPTHYGLGKSGWVTGSFKAGAKVPVDLLKDWMEESYRAVAPKKLVAALDGGVAAAPAPARKAATKKR